MSLIPKFLPKCDKYIKEYITKQNVLDTLNECFDIKHRVAVMFIPAQLIGDDDKCGWGAFLALPSRFIHFAPARCSCVIMIAARPPFRKKQDKHEHVIGTLIHELVHYEQWREGKSLTEKNVERKVQTIWKKIMK